MISARVAAAAGLLTAAVLPPVPHRMLEGGAAGHPPPPTDMREVLTTLPKSARSRVVFKVGDDHLPLVKAKGESMEHLLMKALLWALMLPSMANIECELDIGHRYKPGARLHACSPRTRRCSTLWCAWQMWWRCRARAASRAGGASAAP